MSGGTMSLNTGSMAQLSNNLSVADGHTSNALAQFFGPSNQNAAQLPYAGVGVTHYTLPHAFEGLSMYLKDTVEGLWVEPTADKPDLNWQTRRALPFMHEEMITVRAKRYQLEPGMIPQVPHEGMTRMMKMSEYTWGDSQKRYAISFDFENEFYKTAKGLQQYRWYTMGVAKYVQERANHEVTNELKDCKTQDMMFQENYGAQFFDYSEVINEEAARFGALNDEKEGYRNMRIFFDKAVESMRVDGAGTPDLMVVSVAMLAFMSGIEGHPKTLDYWAFSPTGKLLLKTGVKGYEFSSDVDLVVQHDYSARKGSLPIRLLNRVRVIGEFYTMYSRAETAMCNADARSIYIYNASKDAMSKITLKQALLHCNVWNCNNDGNGYDPAVIKHIRTHAQNWGPYNVQHQQDYCNSPDTMILRAGDKTPFPLSSCTASGEHEPVEYIGQLENHAIRHSTLIQMAHTAGAALCKMSGMTYEAIQSAITDIHLLVDEIERIDTNGIAAWVGQTGGKDLSTHNGFFAFVRDVAPNAFGCNSGPGIRALAEATPRVGIAQEMIDRAKRISTFMGNLARFLDTTFMKSEFNNISNAEEYWDNEMDKRFAVIYGLFCMRRPNVFLGGNGNVFATPVGSDAEKWATELLKCNDQIGGELQTFANMYLNSLPTEEKGRGQEQLAKIYRHVAEICVMKEGGNKSNDVGIAVRQLIAALTPSTKAKTPEEKKKEKESDKSKGEAIINNALKAPYVPAAAPTFSSSTQFGKDAKRTLFAWSPNASPMNTITPGNPETGYMTARNVALPSQDHELIQSHQEFLADSSARQLKLHPILRVRGSIKKGGNKASQTSSQKREVRFSGTDRTDDDDFSLSKIGAAMGRPQSQRQSQYMHSGDLYGTTSGTTQKKEMGSAFTHPGEEAGRTNMLRPHLQHRWEESNQVADGVVRMLLQIILLTRCDNYKQWCRLIDSGIHFPFNFLLWRLFMEFEMETAIVMKSGPETGATLFGHTEFRIGSDTIRGVWTAYFSTYMKPMVWMPKNVRLIEDILFRRYRCGMNSLFFTNDQSVNSHIIGGQHYNQDRPSIISTLVPDTEPSPKINMCFCGPLNVPFARQVDKTPTYSTFELYREVYPSIIKAANRSTGMMRFSDISGHTTALARQGLQANHNPHSGIFNDIVKGTGHLQDKAGPGCRQAYDGRRVVPHIDWKNVQMI